MSVLDARLALNARHEVETSPLETAPLAKMLTGAFYNNVHSEGQGLTRMFYQGLFDHARAAGHARMMCEINSDPPNPGSLALHAALGFAEIDQAKIGNGKVVSDQMCAL